MASHLARAGRCKTRQCEQNTEGPRRGHVGKLHCRANVVRWSRDIVSSAVQTARHSTMRGSQSNPDVDRILFLISSVAPATSVVSVEKGIVEVERFAGRSP